MTARTKLVVSTRRAVAPGIQSLAALATTTIPTVVVKAIRPRAE
jgi:hypothetical protein